MTASFRSLVYGVVGVFLIMYATGDTLVLWKQFALVVGVGFIAMSERVVGGGMRKRPE